MTLSLFSSCCWHLFHMVFSTHSLRRLVVPPLLYSWCLVVGKDAKRQSPSVAGTSRRDRFRILPVFLVASQMSNTAIRAKLSSFSSFVYSTFDRSRGAVFVPLYRGNRASLTLTTLPRSYIDCSDMGRTYDASILHLFSVRRSDVPCVCLSQSAYKNELLYVKPNQQANPLKYIRGTAQEEQIW